MSSEQFGILTEMIIAVLVCLPPIIFSIIVRYRYKNSRYDQEIVTMANIIIGLLGFCLVLFEILWTCKLLGIAV